jgi:hypothetical protein
LKQEPVCVIVSKTHAKNAVPKMMSSESATRIISVQSPEAYDWVPLQEPAAQPFIAG